jgi:catechol 2,3-dioxygenase
LHAQSTLPSAATAVAFAGMTPRDPEEATASDAPAVAEIAPRTRMGAVHLTVSDLDRSVGWYEHALGLRVHAREDARAALGAGAEDLLVLHEEPGARPARGFCGLYHFALLVPERTDLARWLLHVARERIALTGLSDHFVSEAVYLSDPDEHGIEVYWDRPREVWEGQVADRLTTAPLDTDALLRTVGDVASATFDGMAGGTVMGHVHLRVADVAPTVAFYRDVLGFALMASLGTAAFLSAGGYHHHIGANVWESAGAPPAPEGTARLHHATVVLPDEAAREEVAQRLDDAGALTEGADGGPLVRDPSGNALLLAVG